MASNRSTSLSYLSLLVCTRNEYLANQRLNE